MGKMEAGFTLERDKNKMMVLNFGFDIQVVFKKLGLPKIPSGNEAAATWLEMFFDLFEDKKLFFASSEMVDNGNTEDVVEERKIFPAVRFGDISLQEMGSGVVFKGFFQ